MRRIARLLYVLSTIGILVGVAFGVAALFAPPIWLLVSSAIALSIGILLLLAARRFRRGAGKTGALLLSLALIEAAAAYATLSPGGTAFIALIPVIIVAVILPYVRMTTLMWVFAATWVVGAGIVALNLFLIPPARIPGWLDLSFRAVGYAALLALTLSMLFQHHRRNELNLESARADADALRRAHRRLQEFDEAKTRFLNSAAHELRTPLTPIMIQLGVLQQHPAIRESPRSQNSILLIDRNMHRLKSHLDALLDIARLQSERVPLNFQELDLHTIVREAVESYRESMRSKGIQLETESQPGIRIQGDPDRLLQVFFNLLSNAVKATQPGGKIFVACESDEEQCRITVSDTGKGIAPEDQKRLFEPFERVRASDGGAGLGLFISRKIVEDHHGQIGCTSEGTGKGCTFTVSLPLHPPHAPKAEDQGPMQPPSDPRKERPTLVSRRPSRHKQMPTQPP